MKPEDFLKRANMQLKAMREMKEKSVDVGVIANEATGRIYEDGATVLEVAATHEFGLGNSPQRSFLKMPQELKKEEISKFIRLRLIKVLDGKNSVSEGLGLIGVYNVNIIQDAFTTSGFGKWAPLDDSTVSAKGKSKPLIDTGTLKNSISYEVK